MAAVVGVLVAALVHGSGSAGTPGTGSPVPSGPPSSPARPVFTFEGLHWAGIGTGGGTSGTSSAAKQIEGELSSFYDVAFLDPSHWDRSLPVETWSLFDASVRTRAEADAPALTLGPAGARLRSLSLSTARLDVRVFFDPRGRPTAAMAAVSFIASGRLTDGTGLEVRNGGSYLLRPVKGAWFVVGYPGVRTEVESTPPPSPTPTLSPTPLPAPSGSASP